jgi:hypothetical protein
VRRAVRIAEIGMTMRIPSMKLQNDFPISNDLFVFGASVAALAIEQLLVPLAASLDVSHSNEWLSLHSELPCTVAANARILFFAAIPNQRCFSLPFSRRHLQR